MVMIIYTVLSLTVDSTVWAARFENTLVGRQVFAAGNLLHIRVWEVVSN